MKQIKLQQVGKNINYKIDEEPLQTIVTEKPISDVLFRYAFLYNQSGSNAMKNAFLKELETFKIPVAVPVQKYVEKHQKKVLKGIIANPQIISEKAKQYLINLKDSNVPYKHYIKFLNLLYTNPIQSIREKLLDVVIDNKLPITPNGYIVGARQVVKTTKVEETGLYDFIQSEVFKVRKKWKKAVNKFLVYQLAEKNSYVIKEIATEAPENSTLLGNLANLSKETPVARTVYTDHYSGKMRWSVGDVCKIPRNFNNTEQSCGSQMLHIRTNVNELSGFGDTNILVLINPRDVISAKEPKWKIGVCEFYFAAIMTNWEIPNIFDEVLGVFENEYQQKDTHSFETEILPVYQGEFDKDFYQTIVENRVEWI